MNKEDYINKASTLLNDRDTYIRLENPPTIASIQTSFNRNVKKVLSSLPNSDTKNLILSKISSKLPSFSYFYGAPKVHKPGIPLRPIIATCGSPQSNLAKWIANCLSSLLGKISDSHLLHSLDFVDRLRNLGPTKGKLISLDVTDLFTSLVLDNLREATNYSLSPLYLSVNFAN